MTFRRSKAANNHNGVDIHATVANWWNDAEVPYVAHAFLNNGQIRVIRAPVVSPASNQVGNHPDQQYWRQYDGGQHAQAVQAVTDTINAMGVANIARIDIDCKLMPCYIQGQYTKCLYQVPGLMRNFYNLLNKPLRVFSHADENMGGGGTGHLSSKRVISCNTSDNNAALEAAYNNHDGWGWVP